ncbi:DNA glycosylase AlkZ-like family protein [Pseudonocardia dioxanivorans]|uniref:DNA glycosylase AlkZ-like family protein n=1 Tax=Pseudonocardia dioxanivorans TaxID=240495 RepID=UPI000CD0E261|nr:crosslink repair DNA glycosylase YcaQ family protein [Pseudonocardia dioxanivorans]
MTPVALDPQAVLAHRLAVHGLTGRTASRVDELAVCDLGVQDTPPGALRAAVSARLAVPLPPAADVTAGGALTLVWSFRGAPHLHRSADLPLLAAVGRPRDDADAMARLAWQRRRLAEAGVTGEGAYREVAEAVAAVLAAEGTVTKSRLSAQVTTRIRPALAPFCRPCDTRHVSEQLLRLAALPAGMRMVPDSRPLTFEAIPGWAGLPAATGPTAPLQRTYLRLFPGGSLADVADFLGVAKPVVADSPAADLVDVTVGGRPGLVRAEDLDTVRADAPEPGLRLLAPSDPVLQGRDRALLVPDPDHRSRLWRPLGSPGLLLAGTEAAGVWRPRQKRTLEVGVTAFRRLTKAERTALEEEAQRLAVVRGKAEATVTLA